MKYIFAQIYLLEIINVDKVQPWKCKTEKKNTTKYKKNEKNGRTKAVCNISPISILTLQTMLYIVSCPIFYMIF
jgi:hypothetical protein